MNCVGGEHRVPVAFIDDEVGAKVAGLIARAAACLQHPFSLETLSSPPAAHPCLIPRVDHFAYGLTFSALRYKLAVVIP